MRPNITELLTALSSKPTNNNNLKLYFLKLNCKKFLQKKIYKWDTNVYEQTCAFSIAFNYKTDTTPHDKKSHLEQFVAMWA